MKFKSFGKIFSIGCKASTLLALALATHSGWAQTSVSTGIVAFQKKSVSTGLNSASFPLLNQDLSKTTVSSVSGNSVTLAGVANAASLLASGEPYYIEVYSGSLKGDRFDLNTAATITAANATVVLDAASANNTYPVASIGTSLNGALVAVRKHVTLAQIQASTSPAMVGNNNINLADQIQLFAANGSFEVYYLRSDLVSWRKSGGTVDLSKTPVPPGTGVIINKRGTSAEILQTGYVRQNDFATPYKAGLQFVGPSVPMDRTPVNIGMLPNTNGWVGNNNVSLADQVLVFQSGSFVPYALRADGQIRRSGQTTDFKNTNLLTASEAWLVKRQNANADLVESQLVGE